MILIEPSHESACLVSAVSQRAQKYKAMPCLIVQQMQLLMELCMVKCTDGLCESK